MLRRLAAIAAIALVVGCSGGPAPSVGPVSSQSGGLSTATASTDDGTLAIPAEADLAQALGNEEARLVAQARADAEIAVTIGANGAEVLAALDAQKIEAAAAFERDLQAKVAGGTAAVGPLAGQLAALKGPPPGRPTGFDFMGATGIAAFSAAAAVLETAAFLLERGSDHPDAYREVTTPLPSTPASATLGDGTRLSSTLSQTITEGVGGGRVSMTVDIGTLGMLTGPSGKALGIVRESAKAHFEIATCPDPNGVVNGKVTVHLESSFTRTEGGGGTAATTDVDASFRFLVNDNAAITRTELQSNVTGSVTGTRSNGDPVDWTASSQLGLNWGSDDSRAQTAVNSQDQGTATKAQLESLRAGAAFLPLLVADEVRRSSQDFIWSGKCVEIRLTAGDGRDVDPEEVVKITAQPRARFTGEDLSAPVVATLDGKGKVEPQGSKVPAPADFRYTAGKDDGDIGTVHLKSTSKRGLGKLDVIYTVRGLKQAKVSLAGGIQYKLVGFTRSITITPLAPIQADLASDGTLHGSGKVHVKFFNQADNGCPTTYEGDLPVTIRVILENKNDKGEISIEVRGPDAPFHDLNSPDCFYVSDIANEFRIWVTSVGRSAAPDAGPHTQSMTVSSETATSTTTMTR
ncbi:MAG: hypothetical protein HY264_04450 [Chloroflexi bacterium]|nr:hypothetical protein [Chloroflexota bacterium]